jgi:NADPH:quinone reductase-like Zn-dependent oxidoreductase
MSAETTMKAAVLKKHGGREAVHVENVPIPDLGPADVRIKVQACALNWLDVAVRRGPKFGAIDLPLIGGGDIAGVIDAVGTEVDSWKPGDEVVVYPLVTCGVCEFCRAGEPTVCPEHKIFGEHIDGGLAEYTVVPAHTLLSKPKNLSFVEAAAVPVVFMTAWHMLITKAELRAGETVLILGAGGGVASAGIEIASLAGAHVLATTSTAQKAERALELGARHVFNYREDNWTEAVLKATGGRGADLIQDNVGAKTWPSALQVLAGNGRLVSTGSHSGAEVTFDLSQVYHRQLRIIGANGGTYHELATVLDLMEKGRLKPIVDTVLPLDKIREGHRLLEDYHHFGKIVIEPSKT